MKVTPPFHTYYGNIARRALKIDLQSYLCRISTPVKKLVLMTTSPDKWRRSVVSDQWRSDQNTLRLPAFIAIELGVSPAGVRGIDKPVPN